MTTVIHNQPKSFLKAITIAKQAPHYRVKFFMPQGKVTVIVAPNAKKIPDEQDWIDEFAGIWKSSEKPEAIIRIIKKNRSLHVPKRLT